MYIKYCVLNSLLSTYLKKIKPIGYTKLQQSADGYTGTQYGKAGYRRGASHTHRFANHLSPVLVGSAACTEYTSALPSGSML